MNKSLYTLHEQTAKRLRGETVSLVLLIAVFIAILLLTLDNALPAAHGDPFVSSFLGGALCGLLATAAVVTLAKIVELRRALTSDIELRRLHAKENDELARHQEAEVSRLLARAQLPIFVICIVVAGALSREAMIGVAALAVACSLARIAIRLHVKRSYHTAEE